MLVALGVALPVVAATQSGFASEDVSRVLQGILAGIGFLGAGAIIKQSENENVKGLTTAASIWATAAIAVAAGLGREATAILATVIAVTILSLLLRLEQRAMPRSTKERRRALTPRGRRGRVGQDERPSAAPAGSPRAPARAARRACAGMQGSSGWRTASLR